MPFGQDGTATQGVRRIHGGYEKVQTKSPRFEPSNPLTILRCTFDLSNRIASQHLPMHVRKPVQWPSLIVLAGRLKPATLTP